VVVFGLLFIVVVLLLPGGLVEGVQRMLGRLSSAAASDGDVSRITNEKTGATEGKEAV
jgi:hypothetical protein